MSLIKVSTNSKLGKRIGSFNMPAVSTCPGRTELCESICYAASGFFRFPKIKRIHNECFEASKRRSFENKINRELLALNLIAVRLHASGDFYSKAYIKKWIRIAIKNPGVKIWAYTRSWRVRYLLNDLNLLSSLPNVQLFASLDQETKESGEEPPYWLRVADITEKFGDSGPSFAECPNQKNKLITCAKCTYCFKPSGQRKQNVIFEIH